MERIGRLLAAIEAGLGHVAGFLLVLLLVLINVEVAARYVFNTSTLMADEYGGYLMAWITMLGAVHILRADRHLTMTAFVDRLSPRARNAAGIVAAMIGLGICIVLLYATCVLVGNSARFGSRSIQPSATPLLWPQSIVPIGYALLCLAYVEEIARRLRGLPPRRDSEEIDVSLS